VAGEIRRAIAEGEAKVASGYHRHAISLLSSRSTGTRSCARCGSCATRGCSSFAAGAAFTVAATPDHGAVVLKARELVRLARKHGYRRDELVKIIKSVD
jgi:hypothetical protein